MHDFETRFRVWRRQHGCNGVKVCIRRFIAVQDIRLEAFIVQVVRRFFDPSEIFSCILRVLQQIIFQPAHQGRAVCKAVYDPFAVPVCSPFVFAVHARSSCRRIKKSIRQIPMLLNGRVPAGFARGRSPSIYNNTGKANKTNKFQEFSVFFFPNRSDWFG